MDWSWEFGYLLCVVLCLACSPHCSCLVGVGYIHRKRKLWAISRISRWFSYSSSRTCIRCVERFVWRSWIQRNYYGRLVCGWYERIHTLLETHTATSSLDLSRIASSSLCDGTLSCWFSLWKCWIRDGFCLGFALGNASSLHKRDVATFDCSHRGRCCDWSIAASPQKIIKTRAEEQEPSQARTYVKLKAIFKQTTWRVLPIYWQFYVVYVDYTYANTSHESISLLIPYRFCECCLPQRVRSMHKVRAKETGSVKKSEKEPRFKYSSCGKDIKNWAHES